jgi:hypothetical protein
VKAQKPCRSSSRNRLVCEDAARRERAAKALYLRIAGASYRQIARQLVVSEGTVYNDIQDELGRLDALIGQKAERLRDLEARRLDQLMLALQPGIRTGDPRAILAAVRINRARRPLTTPLILERAQICIAASADRRRTAAERAAAASWLTARAVPAAVAPNVTMLSSEYPFLKTDERGNSAPLTRDQIDTCHRLHRRIRVRTDVIRRLLEPDPARDDEVTEFVLDLLVEIRGATGALETLLQPKA